MKILSPLFATLICMPCILGQDFEFNAGNYPPNDDPCWSYYDGSWYCNHDQGVYYGGGGAVWGVWGAPGGGWYGRDYDNHYDHNNGNHNNGHHDDGHNGGHGGDHNGGHGGHGGHGGGGHH